MTQPIDPVALIVAICVVIGLLITILGAIWKFNSNIVTDRQIIKTVVEDVDTLKEDAKSTNSRVSQLEGWRNSVQGHTA
jgi:hypothetical protein